MAQLVIFDCDGVLVDSEIIICRIEAEELTRIGFAITPEEMAARFVGISAETTYAEVEAELDRALPSGHEERVEWLVAEAFDHELEPIPGIHEALGNIDLPICVASSGRAERIRRSLLLTGLYERFATNIFSAHMVACNKPAPDLFLCAAQGMGVAPVGCLVIEDSIAGVQAGRAAGMRVFGFTGGSHCAPSRGQPLCAAGAELSFDDMRRLPGLIKV